MELGNLNLISARLALLSRTVKHFNSTNRAVAPAGNCVYSHTIKGGCAIGREVTAALAEEMSKGGGPIYFEKLFFMLPKRLQNLGKDFLRAVQILHDGAQYWNETGLSPRGVTERDEIVQKFCKLTEQQIVARRLELVKFTARHYKSNTRAKNPSGYCSYGHQYNGGCAIGCQVSEKLAAFYDVKAGNFGLSIGKIISDGLPLPQRLKVLGEPFLKDLQGLHDGDTYWNEFGINTLGLAFIRNIAQTHLGMDLVAANALVKSLELKTSHPTN